MLVIVIDIFTVEAINSMQVDDNLEDTTSFEISIYGFP